MKKIIIALLILTTLTGCKGNPKVYGDIIDWQQYDTADAHVIYATSRHGCYSDGSLTSNAVYNAWVKGYEMTHN